MDHDYIVENNIVDRFLMGQLATEEAEVFQDHTMSCQICLDDLATAERMQRGIKRVFETEAMLATNPTAKLTRWFQARKPGLRIGLTLAALLVIAGPTFLLLWRTLSLQAELSESQSQIAILEASAEGLNSAPHPNVPILRLSPERGELSDRPPTFRVRLDHTSEWLVLVLEVSESGPLGARLNNDKNQAVWTTTGLIANEMDEVSIGLQAATLNQGDYTLLLTRPNPDDGTSAWVALFAFRVVRN